MSKAKDRALEAYPVIIKMGHVAEHDINLLTRRGFIKGYHQAEKDLELTWKDIVEIESLLNLVRSSAQYKNGYKEVLKRFQDYKERNK